MTQTDVLAATVSATGAVVGSRARAKALYMVAGANAGSVVLRSGGASGVTRLDIVTPAGADDIHFFIPGEGILFENGIHATLTNVTSLTVFYG